MQRLPFETRSLWRAQNLGNLEFVNWSMDSNALADVTDLLSILLTMIGSIGSNEPPKEPVKAYRPGQQEEKTADMINVLKEIANGSH